MIAPGTPVRSTPRVSVVIPTYNRATLLRETLDSALAQTFRDREIIVVDDGSTDDTARILESYAGRVHCIRQPNAGVNAARNRAVAAGTGEFVALLDSDDLWLPYALELMVALLDRYPDVGFVFTDFHILRPSGAREPRGLSTWHPPGTRWADTFDSSRPFESLGIRAPAAMPRRNFLVHRGDIYASALHRAWVPTSSSLFRRSAAADLRFPEDDANYGDSEFFARLSHRHGALFAEVETMLNRSHDDPVRLTRVDPAIQAQRRLTMVDRVWGADEAFMRERGALVDETRCQLLVKLATLKLLAGQRAAGAAYLQRAHTLGRDRYRLERITLQLAAKLPGSGAALRMLRNARRALRGRRGRAQA